MTKKTKTGDDMNRALRRLLQALSETGTRAAPSDLEDATLVVFAPRNGVTVVRARLPEAVGKIALAQGLAEWDKADTTRRLRLSEAGAAYLRRLAPLESAQSDAFRAQHGALTMRKSERGEKPTLVNEAESPLAWLMRRKGTDGKAFLASAEAEAGERFRRTVEQAQILQRVTANWEAPIASSRRCASSGGVVADLAMDARRRLSRDCDAVGPELAGLLIDVCGYLKGLETVERERGWPARSGKVVLKIALDRLARHYGLAAEAKGPSHARALLHWGAEDYRPSL